MSHVSVTEQRCEGITAAGEQCQYWAIIRINGIPYCRQHGEKEARSLGIDWSAPTVGPAGGGVDGK